MCTQNMSSVHEYLWMCAQISCVLLVPPPSLLPLPQLRVWPSNDAVQMMAGFLGHQWHSNRLGTRIPPAGSHDGSHDTTCRSHGSLTSPPGDLSVGVPIEDLVVLSSREVRLLGTPGYGQHPTLVYLQYPHGSSGISAVPHWGLESHFEQSTACFEFTTAPISKLMTRVHLRF